MGSLRQYWVRGREKVLAYDPRSPANVSKYIQVSPACRQPLTCRLFPSACTLSCTVALRYSDR